MSSLADITINSLDRHSARPGVRPVVRSRMRTIGTFALLLVLSTLIGGYVFVTDPERVRAYSEKQLSELVGGHVTVGSGSLSIFEGLSLNDIRISVDDSSDGDSAVFEAESLHASYNPAALLLGRIEATRILAIEPQIHLVENVDRKSWNFSRLDATGGMFGKSVPDGHPLLRQLPQILLRSARIDYSQIINGQSTAIGRLTIEGQLSPDENSLYRFSLQSRGGTSGVFPIAQGWVSLSGGGLGMVLRDVEFVDEIKTLLPNVVRKFWEEHQLAGRMGETRVAYFFKPDGRPGFRVETDLAGVKMTIPPRQWMDQNEKDRIDRWERVCARLASPVFGSSPIARLISKAMAPGPVRLDEVDGTFVFIEDQISVERLVARLEDNRITLSGTSDGYGADAAVHLRIASLKDGNIVIPESPRYINAMPWPMQELYYRFKPVGAASFWLNVERERGARRPVLSAEVNIRDAGFRFDNLPYPIERASGQLRLTTDRESGDETLTIASVVGHGPTGGPNERATLEVNGRVSPLDDRAGADLNITGRRIVGERRLYDSLPPLTRAAVLQFDADNTRKLPKFSGDFDCHITRSVGLHRPWNIVTDMNIVASGKTKFFPYPIRDARTSMVVHDDFLKLKSASIATPKGRAELTGTLNWARRDPKTGEALVQPDFKLSARALPIDDTLLNALPPDKAKWLRKIDLTGLVDVEGSITSASPTSEEVKIDLAMRVSAASAGLADGRLRLTDIVATADLKDTSLTLNTFSARRGDATIEGAGKVDFATAEPDINARVKVRELKVDADLTDALPAAAQIAVKQIKPSGTVDVDAAYSSVDNYRVAVRPKQLKLEPGALTVALEKLTGEVVIEPTRVTLLKVVGHGGDLILRADGTIDPANGAADLKVAGRDLRLTPELRKMLPTTIGRAVDSVALDGTFAFDLPKLQIKQIDLLPENPSTEGRPGAVGVSKTSPTEAVAQTSPTSKKRSYSVDFESVIWLKKAAMDLGIPMTDLDGVMKMNGRIRAGRLTQLDGSVSFDSLLLANRPIKNLTANVTKPADKDLLQISKIEGELAGGTVAGQIDTVLFEKESRFGLSLVLRNAEVSGLTGELDKPIDGRLTASLALEGNWTDAASRRGSGDVIVEGKKMYRVPVLFGLMQVANLTLPLDSPINQAGIRYTVDGKRVTLENIDLRSTTTAMQGTGWFDFGSRQVRMTLALTNSAADAVPIFGDLIRGARQDLMQIRVKGTIEEPKVGASAFNTLGTTIDEVLNGRD